MIDPLSLPALAIDPASDLPVYRQLYQRVRDAVLEGSLAANARLPSARSLASQLGVARGTVEAAYDQLAGEGYIQARGAAGTFVVPLASQAARGRPARVAPVPPRTASPHPAAQPFQMGLPALDAFPRKLWARLGARRAHMLGEGQLVNPDPSGLPELRAEIARYLAVARGIRCEAGQVIMTAGYQGALGLVTRLLVRPGESVWVEDPGFFRTHESVARAQAALVPVPVDGEGMDVAAGLARAPAARLALVTPAHQSPTGIMLSLARRLALLAWAEAADGWVVEDDYDGEFRYAGRPLPALKSLDRAGRVLYVGTFSKTLFPGLKLGYLVVPPGLADDFAALANALQPMAASLEQGIVADFLAGGHFGRHIRRMRQLYAARRGALLSALTQHFGPDWPVAAAGGGMHVTLGLPPGVDDRAVARQCIAAGLSPTPLSQFVLERPLPPSLLLSFTNVPAERAEAVVERLAKCLADAGLFHVMAG